MLVLYFTTHISIYEISPERLMENTEVTERSPLLQVFPDPESHSRRRSPIQLVCLVIFVLGCIVVTTAIILLSRQQTEVATGGPGGEGYTLGGRDGKSEVWLYVLFLLTDIVVGITCFCCLFFCLSKVCAG